MLSRKRASFLTRSIAFAAVVGLANVAHAEETEQALDYTAMTPEALAEHLLFETNSFRLDQPVQEGGVARQRLEQDEIQRACSNIDGAAPDLETLIKVREMAEKSIVYPDKIELGDWERGREYAWSGFGFRIGHNNDDHTTREAGGNCYNCHQIGADRQGGNLGPALFNYGKNRGNSPEMLRLAYGIIYNAHAFFPCTDMPRIGYKEVLNQQQIADVLAYLFDPESPVNQE